MSAILVVDDEDYLRDLIKEILEMHGHDAVAIGSAQAALQLCQRMPFDLVITDVAMPGMDGLELIRALRAARLDLPVLAISGSLSGQFVRATAPLGAVETLSKPFQLVELLAAVDKSLAKRPAQAVTASTPRRGK